MHSNLHYHSHSRWNGISSENHYEDYVPFTPCLTPTASSDDSSSISSPMISERNFTIKREPHPQSFLKPPTNPSHNFKSHDIKGEHWSPQLHPTMSLSPQGNSPSSYYTSSSSPSYSDMYDSPEHNGSQNLPPKKSRKVTVGPSKSSASRHPSSMYYDQQGRVLNIPAANPADMHPDPSQAYYQSGPSSGRSSVSRGSKGKTAMPGPQQDQSQPRKFRFVSVQSTDAYHGQDASGSGSRDDSKVYLEEHLEDDPDDGPFEHGPSEYPPRPYIGGEYATSPLRPKKATGKIPASNLDFLPVLEARFDRLENAIEKYVEYRGQQALENSRLPHESAPQSTRRRK